MKLAISNIAWDRTDEDSVLQALQREGVDGIEIAPTKVWPRWLGASREQAETMREQFGELGFVIPAVQSVLYDRPDLRVFDGVQGRFALRKHLANVGHLACAFGAKNIVFGSPQNRDRGALSLEEAIEEASEYFAVIGADLTALGVCLCIEANPVIYGCNFLSHWREAAEFVSRIDSPGIGLHLDAACTVLAGDDPIAAIKECGTILRHFHISEPFLGSFSSPIVDHAAIGKALRESGYRGWVSIEMLRQEDPLSCIEVAVRYARNCYV